jgi:hypothetical protein
MTQTDDVCPFSAGRTLLTDLIATGTARPSPVGERLSVLLAICCNATTIYFPIFHFLLSV